MTNEFHPSDPERDFPGDLRQDIAAMYTQPIVVPSHLDRMILSAARARLVRRRRMLRIVRWGFAAAAAAVVMLVLRVNLVHAPPPRVAQACDINHDGRVDILDAYIVARGIAHHDPLPKEWDVNGDGVVDQKDVDFIADQAVHVSGGTAQ